MSSQSSLVIAGHPLPSLVILVIVVISSHPKACLGITSNPYSFETTLVILGHA